MLVFQKPAYKAVLTFVLEDTQNGGGVGTALGLASSIGIDFSNAGGIFSTGNILELMKSRLVVEKTLLNEVPYTKNGKVENISLAEYYIRLKNLRDSWKNNEILNRVQFSPISDRSNFSIEQDSILQIISKLILNNNLSISQKNKKNSIYSIEVVSEDQIFSKLFCEQLAIETSEFYIETKSKKARINVDILEKQADSIRRELNKTIEGVASENDNLFNLNSSLNIKKSKISQRQVDIQANTTILTQLITQLELAKVSLRKETPLIQTIDEPILPLDQEKLSRVKSAVVVSFIFGSVSNIFFSIAESL